MRYPRRWINLGFSFQRSYRAIRGASHTPRSDPREGSPGVGGFRPAPPRRTHSKEPKSFLPRPRAPVKTCPAVGGVWEVEAIPESVMISHTCTPRNFFLAP